MKIKDLRASVKLAQLNTLSIGTVVEVFCTPHMVCDLGGECYLVNLATGEITDDVDWSGRALVLTTELVIQS